MHRDVTLRYNPFVIITCLLVQIKLNQPLSSDILFLF